MPPAFPSYILWGGRRGCGERIDVSYWEVNYSNSWLQGAPTVMSRVCLCGAAKAKVAPGSPQEKGTLKAVLPLDAEGQLPVCWLLVPQVSMAKSSRDPWGQEPAQGWAVQEYGVRIPQASMCKHSSVLFSAGSALVYTSYISDGNPKPLLQDHQSAIRSK